MAKSDRFPRLITAVFDDVGRFRSVLEALLKAGFSVYDVSILAPHGALSDHFDGDIPGPAQLADRPDTPREPLETESALAAAGSAIAEGLSLIGAIGAASLAYAVGGPVGVATGTGAAVESSVEDVLGRFVDDAFTGRFRENLAYGGLVIWVKVADRDAAVRAQQTLAAHGGSHVHEVDAP